MILPKDSQKNYLGPGKMPKKTSSSIKTSSRRTRGSKAVRTLPTIKKSA